MEYLFTVLPNWVIFLFLPTRHIGGLLWDFARGTFHPAFQIFLFYSIGLVYIYIYIHVDLDQQINRYIKSYKILEGEMVLLLFFLAVDSSNKKSGFRCD